MNGRNGKPKISDEQIARVLDLAQTKMSIREIGMATNMAYSTAWKIKNGLYNVDGRRLEPLPKQETEFFEHDKFYY